MIGTSIDAQRSFRETFPIISEETVNELVCRGLLHFAEHSRVKSRCRNARFGRSRPRSTKRRSDTSEMPPKYWQAPFALNAPGTTRGGWLSVSEFALTGAHMIA